MELQKRKGQHKAGPSKGEGLIIECTYYSMAYAIETMPLAENRIPEPNE